MLPPIQLPTKQFTGQEVDLSGVPIYDGMFFSEEPYLVRTDVLWHNKPTELITAAAPEFGDKLCHRDIGGKITVLVLCYGDHADTHRRCLNSIIKTVPIDRLDLRVAANCVGQESMNYLRSLPITKIYKYSQNRYKYPIMRDMLYDSKMPIKTNYFAWFDDNCYVNHNNWLNAAAEQISVQKKDVAMYGIKLYYAFTDNEEMEVRKWLLDRRWHKGKSLRTRTGTPAPNGDCAHFCADWFFLMRTDVAKACDIPCVSLKQSGGAIVIGEQLYQNGYSLKAFNVGKAYVHQPDHARQLHRLEKTPELPWKNYNGLPY